MIILKALFFILKYYDDHRNDFELKNDKDKLV